MLPIELAQTVASRVLGTPDPDTYLDQFLAWLSVELGAFIVNQAGEPVGLPAPA